MPTFFRLIAAREASDDDFRSYQAEGIPVPEGAPQWLEESWGFVSAYDSEARAQQVGANHARKAERRGETPRFRFVAVLGFRTVCP